MPGSFVGRDVELAAIRDLAEKVVRGEGPVAAIIHGDPGTGKSRLLAESCSRIDLDEQISLAGYEPETKVPLASARGLLQRLAKVPGPGDLVGALLFDRAPDAGPIEPIRLFEASHRALAVLGPLLIVVDDVQWVDEDSLALIHYLIGAAEAAGAPAGIVAAARPSTASRSLAGSLSRVLPDSRFMEIELGPPLWRPATGRLPASTLGLLQSRWSPMATSLPANDGDRGVQSPGAPRNTALRRALSRPGPG